MRAQPNRYLFLFAIFLATALVACTTAAPQPTVSDSPPATTATNARIATDTPASSSAGGSGQDEVAITKSSEPQIISTRAPEPTATPGPLIRAVSDVLASTRMNNVKILGLPTSDWINLAISILMVAFGYLVGTWVIRRALPRAIRRTPTSYDDAALEVAGPDVRWLVVLLALHFATIRLTFVPAEAKTVLTDTYFVLGLALASRIGWRLISLGERVARNLAAQQHRLDELDPLIVLLSRASRILLLITAITILMSHFGINITAFAAALGIGGLAISLAAQDTIRDAIAGFIILIDRPFRIGDRIEIKSVGTWGDVMEIGLRTTRIRTRDNRMVIVPNSIIGSNEVVNYSYPDPTYRIQTHVGVAYGTDIEHARRIMIEAVRQVPTILPDKPVDALYIEMGDSAMIFRVRFWIESYVDARRVIDRVHTALQGAMDAAGIQSPFPSQNLYLHLERDEPPSSWAATDSDSKPLDP